MKQTYLIKPLLFFLFLINGLTVWAQKKVSINENWEFSKTVDATNWEKINLPHTWNAKDVIDETPGYYRGIGWYKKKLNISVEKSQKIFLHFEGANSIPNFLLTKNWLVSMLAAIRLSILILRLF